MQTIKLEVQPDHIDSLTKAKPLTALTELIWNAFDADANEVSVSIEENGLSGVSRIVVKDDGHGIPLEDASLTFKNVGGSWKKKAARTKKQKRLLHGKDGKGRLKAFSLGGRVSWDTCFEEGDVRTVYQITGSQVAVGEFTISDPKPANGTRPGTSVTVTEIEESLGIFGTDGSAADKLSEVFAIYLRDYPQANLIYRGRPIDPSSAQKDFTEISLPNIEVEPGRFVKSTLCIAEWKANRERKLCLCNEAGCTLHEIEVGIRPGAEFSFTAYIRSPYVAELHHENRLTLEELEPGLALLINTAKDELRGHFRARKASFAREILQEWKDEGVYPYAGDTHDPVDIARRQVFDICALNVHEFLDGFRSGDTKNRKFILRVLKQALEDSPESLQKIINEVLDLPPEKREDMAKLLESTTLSAIIEASKLVTERLDFIAGLKLLLFDPESKAQTKERSQLHPILESNTWIFGEEFHLTSSDNDLTTVLKKHFLKLRPEENVDEVFRDDGRTGVIDLLLGREIPQNHKNRREFLVIELKRPSQNITLEVKNQLESYALAVARDERFDPANTNWTFIAVSNKLSDDARVTVEMPNLPRGYFHSSGNIKIGLMSWSELLLSCSTRMELFRQNLGYEATSDDGLRLLRAKHAEYLPEALKTD